MHYFRTIARHKKRSTTLLFLSWVIITHMLPASKIFAQACPPNIDFEKGTFEGWTCYFGRTFATPDGNGIFLQNSGPLPEHHRMYSSNTGELDPYGNFPVVCPNGSGHSIKLGDTARGAEAEGVSYEFTIPADDNSFSLIYHYAVVFQSPHHLLKEQPRMVIEVKNITDDSLITCASFTFIAEGTSLPGFEISPNQTDTTTILFKDWTSVSVDLSGNAGKTFRIFFKTADCTWSQHFGYAYVDVDSECSGSIIGAKYCPDDSVVNLVAPFGFSGYTWYDSSLTKILGTEQAITVPPPRSASGATMAVKLEPYDGYGCSKTVFAILENSLRIVPDAGKDGLSCNNSPVPIGTIPKHGLDYTWTPAAGLNDPHLSNPLASPDTTTSYVLTVSNSGGGCESKDTVMVTASLIDTTLKVFGKAAFCIGYGDSAVLAVVPQQSIEWFKYGAPLIGLTQSRFRVTSPGTYYALLENNLGCKVSSAKQEILMDTPAKGIVYPVKYAASNLPLNLAAREIGEKVLWKPAAYLDDGRSFTPTFQGGSAQTYNINLTTAAGCLTVDTQTVEVVGAVAVQVPNAFTPNSDGLNDFLHPILQGVKELHYFRIFSRSGELLYETNSAGPGWDGTFDRAPQSSEVVVWVVSFLGADEREYLKKGVTLLLR